MANEYDLIDYLESIDIEAIRSPTKVDYFVNWNRQRGQDLDTAEQAYLIAGSQPEYQEQFPSN